MSSPSEIDQLVALLYDAILQRPPDADGAAGWAQAIADGLPARDLVMGLLGTPEAERRASLRTWFAAGTRAADRWPALPLQVADVGAAPLDYEDDVYAALLDHRESRLVCFEPNPDRAARARSKHQQATVVEACVGDGTNRQFYETHAGVTSSLFAPNQRAEVDLFEVGDEMQIAEVRSVSTTRLDDVAAARGTHFLKLDVQGGELDVLRHGRSVVQAALAVHSEVEFYSLYDDQPLGWQIWGELDDAGFDLYWFEHLQNYTMRSSRVAEHPPGKRLGWGDAVFFPKVERMLELGVDDVCRLATIWSQVYRAHDLCDWLFEHHPNPDVRGLTKG